MAIKLSATRITTFLQCKRRYLYSYIEKLPKIANPAFRLGRSVHEALELAGTIWMDNSLDSFSKEYIEDILAKYQEVAIREGIYDSVDYFEGINILKNRLHNFEPHGTILQLETPFGFKNSPEVKTQKGVSLIGAIDKVVEVDEDTLMIVDYKTSRTVPDTTKLRTDVQLSMYNFVGRILYPGYKRIILVLDMLRPSEFVYTYRTDEELVTFESFLEEVYKQMIDFDVKKAKGELNPLCGWCDFRDKCPECKAALEIVQSEALAPDQLSVEDLHNEWNSVKASLKLIEMRKNELASYIMELLDRGVDDIANDTDRFIIEQRRRVTYNPEDLSSVIPHADLVKLVSIKPKKLKDYIRANPQLKDKIEATSKTAFNSPFVSTRKVRKTKKK